MNLKSLVLGAGLITLGVSTAAWAYPSCKAENPDKDQMRDTAGVCQTERYKFNKNGNCTCPGYYESHTLKCRDLASKDSSMDNSPGGYYIYSCLKP